MVEAFRVQPSVLESDADVWSGWRDRLTAIADAVPLVGAQLDPLAFSLLPGAGEVQAAYASAASALKSAVQAGGVQFTGISDKLTWAAGEYAAAEEQNLADIRAVSEV